MKTLFVYMITNVSRGVLYIGVTNSLVRRIWQHQQGEIEGFSKRDRLNRLVYYESFERPHDAISREKEIKGWTRAKKNALINTKNPKWADHSSMLFQRSRDPSPSTRFRMTGSKAQSAASNAQVPTSKTQDQSSTAEDAAFKASERAWKASQPALKEQQPA